MAQRPFRGFVRYELEAKHYAAGRSIRARRLAIEALISLSSSSTAFSLSPSARMNRLYGAMPFADPVAAPRISVENCFRSASDSRFRTSAIFVAHLVLRLLPLGRQDEEPDRRDHRRQHDPGEVGGGRGRGGT